ncbi:unnamed protein product [Lactuca saligna]|uniref:Uncharacterized protein n=1 Tax=Lactuca saligna TaxID=75948 RepID=A0AA36EEK2_LACSI|nr:unnamed protein product [Lactuca saligna]
MFSIPQLAHDLTWHAQGRVNNGKLTHPHDTPSWKLVDNTWKEFGQEKRNLRLALSSNVINPHKKFMMLNLLISGPNQPGHNIDVYLAPLIEDLKSYNFNMQETGKTEEEIDRTMLWKKARELKTGGYESNVKIIVDRIDELQNSESFGQLTCGTHDVLTEVLGTEEQRGSV